VRTAVVNKRAGGVGLIVGRKAFQRPMAEGVELIHAIQAQCSGRCHQPQGRRPLGQTGN